MECLEARGYARYRLAEGVRRAIDAWGLNLCANDPVTASNSVSAIMVPEGFDAKEVIAIAFNRYNIEDISSTHWPDNQTGYHTICSAMETIRSASRLV